MKNYSKEKRLYPLIVISLLFCGCMSKKNSSDIKDSNIESYDVASNGYRMSVAFLRETFKGLPDNFVLCSNYIKQSNGNTYKGFWVTSTEEAFHNQSKEFMIQSGSRYICDPSKIKINSAIKFTRKNANNVGEIYVAGRRIGTSQIHEDGSLNYISDLCGYGHWSKFEDVCDFSLTEDNQLSITFKKNDEIITGLDNIIDSEFSAEKKYPQSIEITSMKIDESSRISIEVSYYKGCNIDPVLKFIKHDCSFTFPTSCTYSLVNASNLFDCQSLVKDSKTLYFSDSRGSYVTFLYSSFDGKEKSTEDIKVPN